MIFMKISFYIYKPYFSRTRYRYFSKADICESAKIKGRKTFPVAKPA